MSVLFAEETKKLVEALLFVAYEPLTDKKLADLAECDIKIIQEILADLQDKYADAGYQLSEIAEGWQFLTRPEFAPYIEKLYRPRTQQLSRASLETLAIVAYRQPVTRQDIENIRQVNVDGVVSNLLDKKLIKEVGRRDAPGRPILYGTTNSFLEFFGLSSIKELPPIDQFIVADEQEAETE